MADSDIQFFWDRREIPAARDELRLALKEERDRRIAEGKKRVRLARASRLESLLHTPAWDELREVLEEQEEKFWNQHLAAVRRGEEIDQRKLDRALGKLDGIRALLDAPEKAARILAVNNSEETA